MISLRFFQLKPRLTALFKSGMSPHELAMTVAVGSALGVFPILGVSSFLCIAVAAFLRLNQVWIQVVNYAVYPLQLSLAGLFFYGGSRLMGEPLTFDGALGILGSLRDNVWSGVQVLRELVLWAVGVWLLLSPLIILGIYFTVRIARALIIKQRSKQTVTP